MPGEESERSRPGNGFSDDNHADESLDSGLPDGFDQSIAAPRDGSQAQQWQNANRSWWENHPMRYDWKNEIQLQEFSREFYLEIDKRFFSAAQEFLPISKYPFDALIDFKRLKDQDVLEIGVGIGSHAQLLAEHAKTYTGIDITDYAVKSTSKRFQHFEISGEILRMDAEKMNFEDDSFDFIWSWGVIHHSSNTENILKEACRVLRPGGMFVSMVYHRNIWNYFVMNAFFRGVLQGAFLRTGSLHEIVQKSTDGAIARFYTSTEWRDLASPYFSVTKILLYGTKSELVPLPAGRFKNWVLKLIPNRLSRFLTSRLKHGTLLVAEMELK